MMTISRRDMQGACHTALVSSIDGMREDRGSLAYHVAQAHDSRSLWTFSSYKAMPVGLSCKKSVTLSHVVNEFHELDSLIRCQWCC